MIMSYIKGNQCTALDNKYKEFITVNYCIPIDVYDNDLYQREIHSIEFVE